MKQPRPTKPDPLSDLAVALCKIIFIAGLLWVLIWILRSIAQLLF